MKTNALVRIVIYSLVIILLLGILMAGIGWNLFSFRRASIRTDSSSTEVSEPDSAALENIVLSPEGLRSIKNRLGCGQHRGGAHRREPNSALWRTAPQAVSPWRSKQSGSEW